MSSTPSPDDLILRFERRDGRPVRVRSIATDAVAASSDADPARVELSPDQRPNAHSPDFATVRWNGETYTLVGKQRVIVASLWQARENGTPHLTGAFLLEEADSVGSRVADLFKRSPAWGRLVCRSVLHGGEAGCFCLPPPID
jgi:hypothetical protein